jgi:hypothetical protein
MPGEPGLDGCIGTLCGLRVDASLSADAWRDPCKACLLTASQNAEAATAKLREPKRRRGGPRRRVRS